MNESEREFDIVVFGATGYAGELAARYLADHAPGGTRIALAGRNESKLATTRSGLPAPAHAWPLIIADSDSPASLDAMAARARVVATTVGPYLKYGEALLAAVARAGTDYVDLTGEVPFVRYAIDHCGELAAETGARIVPSCGYDSIPSDLGVWVLHQQAQREAAGTLGETTAIVTDLKGSLSGGTIDTMRVVTTLAHDKEQRKLLLHPYALSSTPNDQPERRPAPSATTIERASNIDPSLSGTTAPFLMASHNTRIVRRSEFVLDGAYGPTFSYRETMRVKGNAVTSRIRAGAVAFGLGALFGGLSMKPTRLLLDPFLPKPGQGPSEKSLDNGHFTLKVFTTTSVGKRYVATLAAQGDPGYKATAMMFGESALALALDRDKLSPLRGVITPASAMGDALTERLRGAGMVIDVEALN